MKKKQSLFNSGKTMFTPEEWEIKRKEIDKKAEKYDNKHDVGAVDDQLIKKPQDRGHGNK